MSVALRVLVTNDGVLFLTEAEMKASGAQWRRNKPANLAAHILMDFAALFLINP